MQIVCFALAGLLACAWLRELGLARAPALVGGLAFAIAPYRVAQSVGHLLGPVPSCCRSPSGRSSARGEAPPGDSC